MSNYLLHLTHAGYEDLMSILSELKLQPGPQPFGCGKTARGVEERHKSVCFSEIPLGYLSQLVKRRTLYGLGFLKTLATSKNVSPVWYLEPGSPAANSIKKSMKEAKYRSGRILYADESKEIWKLTPYVELQRPHVNWQWEREWRVVGDFCFNKEHVAFLLIPEKEHKAARAFFEDFYANFMDNGFDCIYLDASWSHERILEEITVFKTYKKGDKKYSRFAKRAKATAAANS